MGVVIYGVVFCEWIIYLFTWKEFIDVVNRIEVFLVERVGARIDLQHGSVRGGVTRHSKEKGIKNMYTLPSDRLANNSRG